MDNYRNFRIASYMYAYYAAEASDQQIREDTEKYLQLLPLKKVYVENHRGLVDVPVSRLKEIKGILEGYGLEVSGGITSTALVDEIQKPALFDTFCYTDPRHREEYLRIVREAAEAFDEIILDDYFFTSCRCEMCIAAKGKRTWKDFRQEQMQHFSKEIVEEAKRVNPRMHFVIKYPNWHESYHATGYNPLMQKDIFDGIYTGTETRDPFNSAQHLQRWVSYGNMRLLENAAPGRNGGGWIDPYGSESDCNVFLEQAEFTLLGGAQELTMFNFQVMLGYPALAAMDTLLRRVDNFLDEAGKPQGVAVWEPFDAEGEDQLVSYLAMCGLALEQTPHFPENAPAIILTARAACIPDVVDRLESYVRKGGKAIVTVGFLHETYDRGIREMTSVRLTHRHAAGSRYMIVLCDNDLGSMSFAEGKEPVLFEALDYKTNASWPDVLMMAGEDNFPVLTEDFYGKGRLLILNMPENFADLYKLPAEVISAVNKVLSYGEPCYLASAPKMSLIRYDNGALCVHSFRPALGEVRLVVRGDAEGVRNLVTGEVYRNAIPLPGPNRQDDAALTRSAPPEYAYDIPIGPGESLYLKIL